MRLLATVALPFLLSAPALACDFAGPVAPLTVLERSPNVVIARAESTTRFRISESLAGALSGTHTFRGTDCDPVLVPGRPYLLFLTQTDARVSGTAMNDSAIELPDDGLSIRTLVALLAKWRASSDSARRALLPEMIATRVPALVTDAIDRALAGKLDDPICAQLVRLDPPPRRAPEIRERCALILLR